MLNVFPSLFACLLLSSISVAAPSPDADALHKPSRALPLRLHRPVARQASGIGAINSIVAGALSANGSGSATPVGIATGAPSLLTLPSATAAPTATGLLTAPATGVNVTSMAGAAGSNGILTVLGNVTSTASSSNSTVSRNGTSPIISSAVPTVFLTSTAAVATRTSSSSAAAIAGSTGVLQSGSEKMRVGGALGGLVGGIVLALVI